MKKLLAAILLAVAALAAQADVRLTNVISGNVTDYGLKPVPRCNITVTLLSPNPRIINNFMIRQDPIGTMTDTNGAFAFTNFQWGNYSLNIQGQGGTTFKFVVGTNASGAVAIGTLITNVGTMPPNPATSYYTQAQMDAALANPASASAINAAQLAAQNYASNSAANIVTQSNLISSPNITVTDDPNTGTSIDAGTASLLVDAVSANDLFGGYYYGNADGLTNVHYGVLQAQRAIR